MYFPEGIPLEDAVEVVWDKMTELRESGLQHVEGDLHMEGEVRKAEVKGVASKPAEFITLTFHVEDS